MGSIFADIRKINSELQLAEEALQNSGLEEFTGMGYEDKSDTITKAEGTVSTNEVTKVLQGWRRTPLSITG